jgi:hypothetical protein
MNWDLSALQAGWLVGLAQKILAAPLWENFFVCRKEKDGKIQPSSFFYVILYYTIDYRFKDSKVFNLSSY